MITSPAMHALPEPVKSVLRAARRRVKGSPIQLVFRELQARGVDVGRARVLEVFGGDGTLHLKDYASRVRELEVWEMQPEMVSALGRRFPKATVRSGDSFKLMTGARSKFDVVVIDNPTVFSATPRELFLDALERVSDEPVFILTVVTDLRPATRAQWKVLRDMSSFDQLLEGRRQIFPDASPEDISLDAMASAYGEMARSRGFELQWHFGSRRNFSHYLVFRLRRATGAAPPAEAAAIGAHG